jgi:hypothetical protein
VVGWSIEYFFAKANDRRKNIIAYLEKNEGKIEEEENLTKYITVFHKNLFVRHKELSYGIVL